MLFLVRYLILLSGPSKRTVCLVRRDMCAFSITKKIPLKAVRCEEDSSIYKKSKKDVVILTIAGGC